MKAEGITTILKFCFTQYGDVSGRGTEALPEESPRAKRSLFGGLVICQLNLSAATLCPDVLAPVWSCAEAPPSNYPLLHPHPYHATSGD